MFINCEALCAPADCYAKPSEVLINQELNSLLIVYSIMLQHTYLIHTKLHPWYRQSEIIPIVVQFHTNCWAEAKLNLFVIECKGYFC